MAQRIHSEDLTLAALSLCAQEHMNACKVHTHSYRAWCNVYAIANSPLTYAEVKEHMTALLGNPTVYNIRKNIYRKVLDQLNTSQTKQE